jgi:uncharacterized protein YggU (UPF0235/DUF167 family)
MLFIRVVPSAAFDKIAGVFFDSNDVARIKVCTTRPAHSGQANNGVLAVLSKYLGLPKSLLSVKSGAAARSKTILIDGVSEEQRRALEATIKTEIQKTRSS